MREHVFLHVHNSMESWAENGVPYEKQDENGVPYEKQD